MHVKHRNESKPPIEVVRSRVSYDPTTGSLEWKECGPEHFVNERAWRIWLTKFGGKPVAKRTRGYVVVVISYQGHTHYLLGHRVAWAIHNGAWPEQEIDHSDGDRGNNRITNLREADHIHNQWNKGKSVRNKSGFKGVHKHTQNGTWIAQFRVPGGKTKYLGSFIDLETAASAYEAEARRHHQQFARFQ